MNTPASWHLFEITEHTPCSICKLSTMTNIQETFVPWTAPTKLTMCELYRGLDEYDHPDETAYCVQAAAGIKGL